MTPTPKQQAEALKLIGILAASTDLTQEVRLWAIEGVVRGLEGTEGDKGDDNSYLDKIDGYPSREVEFQSLAFGACFRCIDADDGVYIKRKRDDINNAVHLGDDEPYYFGKTTMVVPV